MLTKEMQAQEMLATVRAFEKELENKRTWCEKCAALETAMDREFCASKWYIGSSFDVAKEDLPKIRKVVGRFKMVGKTNIERGGEDYVRVLLEPESKDWKPLRFAYTVKYRPGKCKIVEQTMSYKTLVCSK